MDFHHYIWLLIMDTWKFSSSSLKKLLRKIPRQMVNVYHNIINSPTQETNILQEWYGLGLRCFGNDWKTWQVLKVYSLNSCGRLQREHYFKKKILDCSLWIWFEIYVWFCGNLLLAFCHNLSWGWNVRWHCGLLNKRSSVWLQTYSCSACLFTLYREPVSQNPFPFQQFQLQIIFFSRFSWSEVVVKKFLKPAMFCHLAALI